MRNLFRDLLYGVRMLRKSPGFTAVALLSLALGVGANTAIFQLIDAVRLRALPVADASELVEIRLVDRRNTMGDRKSTRLNSSHANISYAVFCLKKKKKKTK